MGSRVVWLLVLLLVAHLVLANWSGHAQDFWPQLTMMTVQGTALWCVYKRYRRSPSLIMLPWLLLALAALMQVLWATTNLLTTILSDKGGYLTAVGVVFSAMYMVPCMYMVTRSFGQPEPRVIALLDLVLCCAVTALLYSFITQLLSGPLASDPSSVYMVIHHADAVDFSLAAVAILRMFGARSFRWRFFYYVASTYLLVNAIVAFVYNRIELQGLPWWGGSMVDIPYVLLVLAAVRQPPAWLRAYRPSLPTAQTIASFAPIILSMMVVMLGISFSRINFTIGLLTACASVLFYGLRVALIHSREMDIKRAVDLSTMRLEEQVGRDPLTGIANRTALDARLREALEEGRRTSSFCSLLMIDIDFFKQYNDSLGHIAGDACLIKVACALSSSQLRTRDLVARYGGEEFVVVLADAPPETALEVARRLATAIERLQIVHPSCPNGHITVSIGIASQARDTTLDALSLLEEADRALYVAKSRGRNRVELAGEPAQPRPDAPGSLPIRDDAAI